MKLKFNLRDYQKRAIQSVISLFDGQSIENSKLAISRENRLDILSGNNLEIRDEKMLLNLNSVQMQNTREEAPIAISPTLEKYDFTLEMETGTGKTYVYLKTIAELSKAYGWKKYVIVVPSTAIREGVISEYKRLEEELKKEIPYPTNFRVYDSKKIEELRGFYSNNSVEILLMTMQSFNSDNNILNMEHSDLDVEKPINFIKAVRPIVILDEPQKMEGSATQEKLNEFNSLFTLRYSATHLNIINPIFRYTPIDAYNENYVKKIDVLSVFGNERENVNAYVELVDIGYDKTGKISAKIKYFSLEKNGIKVVTKTVKKNGFDLYEKSGLSEYKGYEVIEIDVPRKRIEFKNGISITENNSSTQDRDQIMQIQVYESIKAHLDYEKELTEKGIKVLSLFFIDKVKNFRGSNSEGKGKILRWFENSYRAITSMPDYKEYAVENIEEIIAAYFSEDKKEKTFLDTNGNTKKDLETYNLIMKNKEELLSLNNSKRFIFSHTALREGWDNPNVFVICTLNESISEMKKRQEIGRGLRLAVNKDGERVLDEKINVLTVVANQSYENFAKALQHEVSEDMGVEVNKSIVTNARNKRSVQLNTDAFENKDFRELWSKIKKKSMYLINVEDDLVIDTIVGEIKLSKFNVTEKRYRVTRTAINEIEENKISGKIKTDNYKESIKVSRIPNVIKKLMDNTGLTKSNIIKIINKANISHLIFINPEQFVINFTEITNKVLPTIFKQNISYIYVNEDYNLDIFDTEIKFSGDRSYIATDLDENKTLYSSFPLDSETELNFANKLNIHDDSIKFFVKLPSKFKINTPAGSYNPDWAIVFEDEGVEKFYLIRETKNTGDKFDKDKLLPEERHKIEYAKVHFDFMEVDYQVVQNYDDLISNSRGVYNFNDVQPIDISEELISKMIIMKKNNIGYEDMASIIGKEDIEKYNVTSDYYDLMKID